MRIMAIDYGDQRTGIAVSDLTGSIAGDAFVIQEWNPERLAERIAEACGERQVERLILGLPLNMDGSQGERAEKSLRFGELLRERTGLPVTMWDERRTTVDAHRILTENGRFGKKRKATVDAVAATLILEAFLGSV